MREPVYFYCTFLPVKIKVDGRKIPHIKNISSKISEKQWGI